MRRLVLMRHAKTEGNNPGGDHARELLPRGVQDAQEVGIELRGLGLQHALVSTATRTRQTFAALGLDLTVEYLDSLYHDGTETMLRHITGTGPEVTGLLVVGHAPTIPGLAAWLSQSCDPEQADAMLGWYPTASFTEFTFDGAWADLLDLDGDHVRLERIQRR